METLAALIVLAGAVIAYVLLRDGWSRIAVLCAASWREGLRGKATLIVYAGLGLVLAAGFFISFGVSYSTAVAFGTCAAALLIGFELVASRRDSERDRTRAVELAAARRQQLATGEGWTRSDVLEHHKTTLYFRSAGKVETTDGWRCVACGKNLYRRADATVDHIKPQSKYPGLRATRDNLQILCLSCNSTKKTYDGEDWKQEVRGRRRKRKKSLQRAVQDRSDDDLPPSAIPAFRKESGLKVT